MDEPRRSAPLGLQVLTMILTALLPVSWLIGRRAAPAVRPLPLLVGAGGQVALQESPAGLASGGASFPLPALQDRQGSYRLTFYAAVPGRPARPPYRLRLEGPDGGDLWQGTWSGPEGSTRALDLIVPGALLRPGKHALRVDDAGGTVHSYPFVVP